MSMMSNNSESLLARTLMQSSCDKGQGKVIIIMQDDDGEVYLLAVLDDADENQPNIDMMLTKLKFPFKGRF